MIDPVDSFMVNVPIGKVPFNVDYVYHSYKKDTSKEYGGADWLFAILPIHDLTNRKGALSQPYVGTHAGNSASTKSSMMDYYKKHCK